MSDDSKVLAKVASVLMRMPDSENMEKEARLSKALKMTGLVGAAAGTGAMAGSAIGHSKGKKKGRQEQLNYDMTRFRRAAGNIYNMGRTHGMVQLANKIKQKFSSGLQGSNKGSSIAKLPKIKTQTIKKASLDPMAQAVYKGWATSQIPTEHIQNLPPRDMAKVAAVVLDKMNDGDRVAEILWNLISEA